MTKNARISLLTILSAISILTAVTASELSDEYLKQNGEGALAELVDENDQKLQQFLVEHFSSLEFVVSCREV